LFLRHSVYTVLFIDFSALNSRMSLNGTMCLKLDGCLVLVYVSDRFVRYFYKSDNKPNTKIKELHNALYLQLIFFCLKAELYMHAAPQMAVNGIAAVPLTK